MFKALIGDIFSSRAQTLVNTVNCVGVMGKGVAFEFKKRFPEMFADYAARCERGEVKLGRPYLYQDPSGARIVNFPTKSHWRAASRVSDIKRGLDYFDAHVEDWRITSVAFPALGCGNGGLEWTEIGPLLYAKLHDLNIDVEVYARAVAWSSLPSRNSCRRRKAGRNAGEGAAGLSRLRSYRSAATSSSSPMKRTAANTT